MWKNRILCLVRVQVCVFFFKLLKLLLFQTRIVLLSFLIFFLWEPKAHPFPLPHTYLPLPLLPIFFFLFFPHLLPISLFASKPYFAKVIKLHPNHSTKTECPHLCRTLSFSSNKQPKIPMAPYLNFRSKLVRKRSMKERRYIQVFFFFLAESNAFQDLKKKKIGLDKFFFG